MAFLCSAIENQLVRPVIDETGLLGEYDFRVQSGGNSDEEFFRALEDQLGRDARESGLYHAGCASRVILPMVFASRCRKSFRSRDDRIPM
jgi:hypothetical protein